MKNTMTKIEKQMRNESVNYYIGALLEQADNPEIKPQIKIWEPKVANYMENGNLTLKQLSRIKNAIEKYMFVTIIKPKGTI